MGQDNVAGVVEVFREIDFGPGEAGDVFGGEAAGLDEGAEDFVVGILASRAGGALLGLFDEEGEVLAVDFEEADGFADGVGLALPFLDELEGFGLAEGDQDGVIVGGGVMAVDEEGGGVGREEEALEHAGVVEDIAVHDEDVFLGLGDGGERGVHAEGAAFGEVGVMDFVEFDAVAGGEGGEGLLDLMVFVAGDDGEAGDAEVGEDADVAFEEGEAADGEEDFGGAAGVGAESAGASGGVDDGIHGFG